MSLVAIKRVQGVETMSFRLECKGNYTREKSAIRIDSLSSFQMH